MYAKNFHHDANMFLGVASGSGVCYEYDERYGGHDER